MHDLYVGLGFKQRHDNVQINKRNFIHFCLLGCRHKSEPLSENFINLHKGLVPCFRYTLLEPSSIRRD